MVSSFPAQIKLFSTYNFLTLTYNPASIIFSPTDPKDVGVHDIQLVLTELSQPSIVKKFKLSIIGIKKPIETKVKNTTTTIVR